MIFFLFLLNVLVLCRSHCGFLIDDSSHWMQNFHCLQWGDSNCNIIACRADNPSCSSQVGGISIIFHNHKLQLNRSGISLSALFYSLGRERMLPLDGSFRDVHQTSAALATVSKIMKIVLCCFVEFFLCHVSVSFFVMCDSVWGRRDTRLRREEERPKWKSKNEKGEKEGKGWEVFGKNIK